MMSSSLSVINQIIRLSQQVAAMLRNPEQHHQPHLPPHGPHHIPHHAPPRPLHHPFPKHDFHQPELGEFHEVEKEGGFHHEGIPEPIPFHHQGIPEPIPFHHEGFPNRHCESGFPNRVDLLQFYGFRDVDFRGRPQPCHCRQHQQHHRHDRHRQCHHQHHHQPVNPVGLEYYGFRVPKHCPPPLPKPVCPPPHHPVIPVEHCEKKPIHSHIPVGRSHFPSNLLFQEFELTKGAVRTLPLRLFRKDEILELLDQAQNLVGHGCPGVEQLNTALGLLQLAITKVRFFCAC